MRTLNSSPPYSSDDYMSSGQQINFNDWFKAWLIKSILIYNVYNLQ